MVILVAGIGYVLYKTCTGGSSPAGDRRGGGGGPGGPSFPPSYPGGGLGGAPPSYSASSDCAPPQSSSSSSGPGFFTGAAGGAALGYMLGRRSGNQQSVFLCGDGSLCILLVTSHGLAPLALLCFVDRTTKATRSRLQAGVVPAAAAFLVAAVAIAVDHHRWAPRRPVHSEEREEDNLSHTFNEHSSITHLWAVTSLSIVASVCNIQRNHASNLFFHRFCFPVMQRRVERT